MEGKFLMKTLFESYGEISRVISVIDRKVLHRGVNSHSSVGYAKTLDTMNDILNLVIRKRELAFVKNMISQSLTEIPLHLAKLLVLKYIEKQTDKMISKVCQIGTRTIHRRIDKAFKDAIDAQVTSLFEKEFEFYLQKENKVKPCEEKVKQIPPLKVGDILRYLNDSEQIELISRMPFAFMSAEEAKKDATVRDMKIVKMWTDQWHLCLEVER